MRTVMMATGEEVAALGLGTWRMGESSAIRASEVAAVRTAFELGWRVVDTAEMYGDGEAERIVGEALAQALRAGTVSRDEVFVVSKVMPQNASAKGTVSACERSLRRLDLDRIDLYLLHWRGSYPLTETVRGMQALQERGWIRHWGVSNFDQDDMVELAATAGGQGCVANQVYYSLSERGVEFDLLPWMRQHRMPLMAYCPLDRGALGRHPSLVAVAERVGATPAQVALAWTVSRPGVMALPKAVKPAHLAENLAAADVRLDDSAIATLDRLFPAPRRKRRLAMT